MGENLEAPGRHAVRAPMQWTAEKNGGFSQADPSDLPTPVVQGPFGPDQVNVQAQRNDRDSLLNFMTLLIQRYRECPELGWGRFEVLEQAHDDVLAHACSSDDAHLVALHNLGPEPRDVELHLPFESEGCCLVDLLQQGTTPVGGGRAELQLDAYGYRWLRLVRPGDRRLL